MRVALRQALGAQEREPAYANSNKGQQEDSAQGSRQDAKASLHEPQTPPSPDEMANVLDSESVDIPDAVDSDGEEEAVDLDPSALRVLSLNQLQSTSDKMRARVK